jgi:hypothetical protein
LYVGIESLGKMGGHPAAVWVEGLGRQVAVDVVPGFSVGVGLRKHQGDNSAVELGGDVAEAGENDFNARALAHFVKLH